MSSCDGHYSLSMQTDGNLVYYDDGHTIWDSGTAGGPGYLAIMQTDGNLVVYSNGTARWASHTNGC